MRYPFQGKIKRLEETSYKLKVMSVAEGRPITRVVEGIVDYAYENLDEEKRKKAIEEVGEFRERKY